jgi:hypothetical protein
MTATWHIKSLEEEVYLNSKHLLSSDPTSQITKGNTLTVHYEDQQLTEINSLCLKHRKRVGAEI